MKALKNNNHKVVAIGGGTGLSTILRGIKKYVPDINAIVTVADDGGGSGVLREELGILPPGDIRNCILALSETEEVMESLLNYRFTDGHLKGQSFGNLFLAAMNGISENFEEAVNKVSHVLRTTGHVIPVTLDDVRLEAEFENGTVITGESNIARNFYSRISRIKQVRLIPEGATPVPAAISAIENAELIILGPGSLYTSIIPNLVVPGISEAIAKSKAKKVYICNLMTQPGETEKLTAFEHVEAILNHAGENIIDYCIVNKQYIPQTFLSKYIEDCAEKVYVDKTRFSDAGITLIERELVNIKNEKIRHNFDALAECINDILEGKF